MLTDGQANASLLFIAGQGQIGIKNVVRFFNLAGCMGATDINHHFRVCKTGHGAVGAAAELFRQKQAATVARQNRNAPGLATFAGSANCAQLGQARAVLSFEHHAVGRVFKNAQDD